MTSTRQRISSADFLKTLAIYGVVFIHVCGALPCESATVNLVTSPFRVGVPIFIILWAYFHERAVLSGKSLYKYSTDRFLRLFLVYLFWTVLYFIINVDLETFIFRDLLTGYWSGYGWAGQYFFIVLFQLIVLFPLLRYALPSRVSTTVIFFLFFLLFYVAMAYRLWSFSLVGSIGDRIFIYWIPYACAGILLSNAQFNIKGYFYIFIGFCGICIFPIEFYILNTNKLSHSAYVVPSVYFASIVLCFSILRLEHVFHKIPTKFLKICRVVSENTLGIFCINPLIILLLNKLIPMQSIRSGIALFIALGVSLTCFVLVFSLGTTLLIKKTDLRFIVTA